MLIKINILDANNERRIVKNTNKYESNSVNLSKSFITQTCKKYIADENKAILLVSASIFILLNRINIAGHTMIKEK